MEIRLSAGTLWVYCDERDAFRVSMGHDSDPRQMTLRDQEGDNTIHVSLTVAQMRALVKEFELRMSIQETAWLIELPDPRGVVWWTGHGWSKDSLQAVRFTRRSDAVATSKALGHSETVATEHIWDSGV